MEGHESTTDTCTKGLGAPQEQGLYGCALESGLGFTPPASDGAPARDRQRRAFQCTSGSSVRATALTSSLLMLGKHGPGALSSAT